MRIDFSDGEPRVSLAKDDRVQVAGFGEEPTQLQLGNGDNWAYIDATPEQLLKLADKIYAFAGREVSVSCPQPLALSLPQ